MSKVSLVTPTALGEALRLSTSIGIWTSTEIKKMAGKDYLVFTVDGVVGMTSQRIYTGRDYGVVVRTKEAAETLKAAFTPFVQLTGNRSPSLTVYYLGEEKTLLDIPSDIITYDQLNCFLRDGHALEPLYTTENGGDVPVTTDGVLPTEGITVVVLPFKFYTLTEMKYTVRGNFPLPIVGYTPNIFKGSHIVAVYDRYGRRIIGGTGLEEDNSYFLILREEGGLCEVACQVTEVNRGRQPNTQFVTLHVVIGEKQMPRKVRWHTATDTDDVRGEFDEDHDVVTQIFINGKLASLHEEFIPPHAHVEVDVMRQVE